MTNSVHLRTLFFTGALLSTVAPFLAYPFENMKWAAYCAELASFIPGVRSLASESSNPHTCAIAFGVSIFFAWAIVLILFLKRLELSPDVTVRLSSLSVSSKLLYAVFGIALILAPLFYGGVTNEHQFSSGFFRVVSSNLIALAVFTGGYYLAMTAVGVALIILFQRKRVSA